MLGRLGDSGNFPQKWGGLLCRSRRAHPLSRARRPAPANSSVTNSNRPFQCVRLGLTEHTMSQLIERLRNDAIADRFDEQQRDVASRVEKLLREMPADPAERARRQRQAFKKRQEAAKLERPAPLAILAAKERELEQQPQLKKALTDFAERRPDPDLTVYQVSRCLNPHVGMGHQRTKILQDGVRLFASLRSRDSVESMIDRLSVGIHAIGMACVERAAMSNNPKTLDTNIRGVNKCAMTLLELQRFKVQRRFELEKRRDMKRADSAPAQISNGRGKTLPVHRNGSYGSNGKGSGHD